MSLISAGSISLDSTFKAVLNRDQGPHAGACDQKTVGIEKD